MTPGYWISLKLNGELRTGPARDRRRGEHPAAAGRLVARRPRDPDASAARRVAPDGARAHTTPATNGLDSRKRSRRERRGQPRRAPTKQQTALRRATAARRGPARTRRRHRAGAPLRGIRTRPAGGSRSGRQARPRDSLPARGSSIPTERAVEPTSRGTTRSGLMLIAHVLQTTASAPTVCSPPSS